MNVLILVIGLITLSESKTVREVSENDIPGFQYVDTSVDPCDNFYQYTCGNFNNFHQRPDDLEWISIYSQTEDELVKKGNEILSSPKLPGDPVALKKAKAAYKACIDTDNTDAIAVKPLEQQLIDEFGGMPLVSSSGPTKFSWKEIGEIVAKTGIQQLFTFEVYNLFPDEYLILPSSDYWEDPTMVRPQSTQTYDRVLEESFNRAARKPKARSLLDASDHFDDFLWKISDSIISSQNGYTDQAKLLKDLQDIKDFKAKLLEGGDLTGTIRPLDDPIITLRQLQNWTDLQFGGEVDMNWVDYFGNILKLSGIDDVDDNVSIYNFSVELFYGVLNLVKNTDPSIVKNFVLLRTFVLLSPDSGKTSRQAFEEYYKSQGLHYYDRWEYCTRKLLDIDDSIGLSLAITRDYERYHFDNNKIVKVVKLFGELKEAFKSIVADSDWVDQKSRVTVNQKIDNITIDLGYPDFVDDQKLLDGFYENVRICEWDNYGNSRRIRAFKQAYALTKLAEQGNFWDEVPFKANAFSRRQNVKIMLPISMLHDLYFSGNNPILDYSRLGTTIGHEMTHHFDSEGIRYDQMGYLLNYDLFSTAATTEAYNKKLECLKKQYNGYYVPAIGKYVNGSKSLNENIADNGGIRKSFLAFQKLIRDKKIRNVSKNYTLEQLFFIGYGTMWCGDESATYLDYIVGSSYYSPMTIRPLGTLSNLQEFSDAFKCPVGSNMNPKDKCLLW